MCIWIDENSYLDSCDNMKLYEYLYHLLVMLASEHRYFSKNEYYDQFAIFGASKLFMRLKNPKQFSDPPKIPKIKSILNYMKKIIYPYKIDFENENLLELDKNSDVIYYDAKSISTYVAEESDIFSSVEFSIGISEINNTVRRYLRKIPYRNNDPEWYNIYVSCLLTILNQINLTKYSDRDLKNISSKDLEKCYQLSKSVDPILFHLPASMKNYIKILTNELHNLIAIELSLKSYSKVDNQSMLKSLIANTLEDD